MNSSDTISQLSDTLDLERARLLSGDILKFESILAEKKRLFEMLLESDAPDRLALDTLRKKASENQALLATTIRAIRGVNGRISAHRNRQVGIVSYSQNGARVQIGGTSMTSFESRS